MNGKAKLKNKTFTKSIVAIMLNFGIASHWWGEILLTICYVLHKVLKSKNKFSPHETLKKK